MAKGYTDENRVAAYMGRTFTVSQVAQAQELLDSVETYIDRETRRSWLLEPVSGEIHALTVPQIALTYAPVASIELITVRSSLVGDIPVTLVNLQDYELLNPTTGMVRMSAAYGRGSFATCNYTPNRPVPADITQAATEILAATLYPTLFPDRLGFQAVQVDSATRITYANDGSKIVVPEHAQRIIQGYLRPILA